MPSFKLLMLGLVPLAVAACVGDSPVTTNDAGGDDSGVTPDTGAPPADAGGTDGASDAAADAPLTCNNGLTACGGTCVDTSIDDKNCGKCAHDCGGVGLCTDGVCQPQVIRDKIAYGPVTMTVDDNGVYFYAQNDNAFQIQKCPLAGCTQTPAIVGTMINYYYSLMGQAGTLVFTSSNQSTKERPTFFYCDDKGCPSSGTVISSQSVDSDGLGSVDLLSFKGKDAYYLHQNAHALRHTVCEAGVCGSHEDILSTSTTSVKMLTSDGTNLFFIDGNGALDRCAASGACTPTVLAGNQNAKAIAIEGTNLFLLVSGASGYQDGQIKTCPTSGNCSPVVFLKNMAYPTSFTVTPVGPAWFAEDVGNLQTCPLQNCVAPINVVKNLASVGLQQLQSNGNFVYWVQNGSIANTQAIFRVAL